MVDEWVLHSSTMLVLYIYVCVHEGGISSTFTLHLFIRYNSTALEGQFYTFYSLLYQFCTNFEQSTEFFENPIKTH